MYKVHLLPKYYTTYTYTSTLIHQNAWHDELITHMKYLNNICNIFQDIKLLDFPIHTHCNQPSKGHLCKRQTERAELTYRLEMYHRTGSYILYIHRHVLMHTGLPTHTYTYRLGHLGRIRIHKSYRHRQAGN